MIDFASLPVPGGYERASWGDVSPGDRVHLLCVDEAAFRSGRLEVWAKGPFAVAELHALARCDAGGGGGTVAEYGERLLRRLK